MSHFNFQSEENYLKTIYKLGNKQIKKLNNIALAKALNLNPATVLEMVRKLVAKDLLKISADKTISLTEKGKKKALLTIRKHRLWEVFLVNNLQYKWNEVHQLAEQLEHIESTDLIDRLEKYLGYPTFDPHGDPIPNKQGKIKYHQAIPLSECKEQQHYEVVNLAETADDFLDYLSKQNIKPGVKIRLVEKQSYDNSCTIVVAKKTVHLSDKVANNILVQSIL